MAVRERIEVVMKWTVAVMETVEVWLRLLMGVSVSVTVLERAEAVLESV